jgi:hypothetical protein
LAATRAGRSTHPGRRDEAFQLVILSVPLFATIGLGTGAVLLAAGYAAAGRCRPAGRRRQRSVWVRGLAGSGA